MADIQALIIYNHIPSGEALINGKYYLSEKCKKLALDMIIYQILNSSTDQNNKRDLIDIIRKLWPKLLDHTKSITIFTENINPDYKLAAESSVESSTESSAESSAELSAESSVESSADFVQTKIWLKLTLHDVITSNNRIDTSGFKDIGLHYRPDTYKELFGKERLSSSLFSSCKRSLCKKSLTRDRMFSFLTFLNTTSYVLLYNIKSKNLTDKLLLNNPFSLATRLLTESLLVNLGSYVLGSYVLGNIFGTTSQLVLNVILAKANSIMCADIFSKSSIK